MENNKIIGEQPVVNDDATSTTSVEILSGSQDMSAGSLLGKFKDVDSLKKAYESLQSEFTKKCQAYNELKKSQDLNDNVQTPFYESETWQTYVDAFYARHPQAKMFSQEIADVLSGEKVMSNDKNPLEFAYNLVLERENEKLTQVLKDDQKLKERLNSNIKNAIVNEYLSQLKNTPSLLNTGGGVNVIGTNKKPSTVAEAGEIAKKLLR